ncbi:MAG: transcription termination factor NusA [bacterium]|nr:transcription termination factor NusA [Coprothermobacterota bacterium]
MASTESKDLMLALDQIAREKRISKESLLEAIASALTSAVKRNFGGTQNISVELNEKTGVFRVLAKVEVVPQVENRFTQIALADARRLQLEVAVGDWIEQEVTPKDFGRLAAQTAKQVVFQKIKEAEREASYAEYADKEGEMINGTIRRKEGNQVYIDLDERSEAALPPKEQVPGERYEIGGRYRVYLQSVHRGIRGPELIVSRANKELVLRLFELEVPEIFEGRVEIKSIAREPGLRSKIAVASREEKIDPVGACVGPKGIRIQAIVRELRGERIDIIRYSRDVKEFIANALSPAKISHVDLEEKSKTATVVVQSDQLSLAIGKEGQNARLAAKLTSWKIDIQAEGDAL